MAKLSDLKKDESPTVTNLGRLIARMALDEVVHRQFLDDAAPEIKKAGLDAKEKKALEDEDWTRILELLGPADRPTHKSPPPDPPPDPPDEEGG